MDYPNKRTSLCDGFTFIAIDRIYRFDWTSEAADYISCSLPFARDSPSCRSDDTASFQYLKQSDPSGADGMRLFID